MSCTCKGPGDCEQFRRRMSLRAFEICSGTCPESRPCTASMRSKYVRAWTAELRKGMQLPSLPVRARNLARDTVVHAMDGFRKVPLEVYEARSRVCSECPLFMDNHCHHERCGCSMMGEDNFLAKLHWASARCPIGKWKEHAS